MTITVSQRTSIMKLWGKVCKDRKWKQSDRALRLATFGKIIGREIASTDEVGRIDECTKLMKELTAMLGVDVEAAREADDLTINRCRVLRNQIAGELVPCLELYHSMGLCSDAATYITSIMEDKNRWWKIDRPVREITIMDLDARPIRRRDGRMMPSQLEQLQYTLAARLNSLRNKAGHSVHDMRTRAGLHCACSKCVSARNTAALKTLITEAPEPVEAVNPF